ncbi:MAG: hypothetical protein CVU29_11660 [Betaproteobacteria bacterium HGW-Betaproteobacteria-22]|nr:MAG: hypothetical protein CVU29_11660 [Betaproteobacteria bacterium HGW-Betaproteobacteria-22]
MSNAPDYDTPHRLTAPHKTYLGADKKIIEAIDNHQHYELGDNKLTMHVNTPGALAPDDRYVKNEALDSARKNAETWTKKVADANGGSISKEIKEGYASAMASLRNVHHEILPKLPLDADLHARKDIEKVIEKTAHALGKKVTVVVGLLASSASFAAEAIDISGKILSGEEAQTSKLKTLGSAVIDKGVEATVGVVDPLGLIETKEISRQLQNGNLTAVAESFNEARLNTASEIADAVIEYSR